MILSLLPKQNPLPELLGTAAFEGLASVRCSWAAQAGSLEDPNLVKPWCCFLMFPGDSYCITHLCTLFRIIEATCKLGPNLPAKQRTANPTIRIRRKQCLHDVHPLS